MSLIITATIQSCVSDCMSQQFELHVEKQLTSCSKLAKAKRLGAAGRDYETIDRVDHDTLLDWRRKIDKIRTG